MHYRPMFGFHDYATDPRSGRPQAHYSWVYETVVTWTAWAMAATCLIGAITFYLKWQKAGFPWEMALGSILFAVIAYWRHSMLARKRAAFRSAVSDYEAMLANP
jgi:hypothetical protein